MTSSTWKDAHDMSCPTISKYISFNNAVAFRSGKTHVNNHAAWGKWPSQLTHILAPNFGAAFFKALLNILFFVSLMVAQASDEVV
jgi:hypothetical protein